MKKIICFLLLCISSGSLLLADEVLLKNGDKLSGKVLEETDSSVTVSTEALGTVILENRFVKKVVKDKKLKGEIAGGVSLSRGNTETTDAEVSGSITYTLDHSEISAKGKMY